MCWPLANEFAPTVLNDVDCSLRTSVLPVTDVVIIGAGAAGLMCALTAAARGRQVMLIDHANKAGKKILMSGGGRCNFTNMYSEPGNFLSQNPHFCKSALARYTQWDFIELVAKHGVPYHEKKLGQLSATTSPATSSACCSMNASKRASSCTWTRPCSRSTIPTPATP